MANPQGMRPSLIHRLYASWTGWPKTDPFPSEPDPEFFKRLEIAWKRDGLRRIGHSWRAERLQFSFKFEPALAPCHLAARVKGRLDHSLRQNGFAGGFSRKVSVRSLGHNTLSSVINYIRQQLDRCDLVDPRYIRDLRKYQWENTDLDLRHPIAASHGRYWYDLHIVMVTNGRHRLSERSLIERLYSSIHAWGHRGPCSLKSISVMPDHLHLAVRGAVFHSPADIAVSLLREVNDAAGFRLFNDRVYLGTFSEYSLWCARGDADSTGASA